MWGWLRGFRLAWGHPHPNPPPKGEGIVFESIAVLEGAGRNVMVTEDASVLADDEAMLGFDAVVWPEFYDIIKAAGLRRLVIIRLMGRCRFGWIIRRTRGRLGVSDFVTGKVLDRRGFSGWC